MGLLMNTWGTTVRIAVKKLEDIRIRMLETNRIRKSVGNKLLFQDSSFTVQREALELVGTDASQNCEPDRQSFRHACSRRTNESFRFAEQEAAGGNAKLIFWNDADCFS